MKSGRLDYGKCSKILNTLYSQRKCGLSGMLFTKYLSELQTKDPDQTASEEAV